MYSLHRVNVPFQRHSKLGVLSWLTQQSYRVIFITLVKFPKAWKTIFSIYIEREGKKKKRLVKEKL